jgi:hypothetical protein
MNKLGYYIKDLQSYTVSYLIALSSISKTSGIKNISYIIVSIPHTLIMCFGSSSNSKEKYPPPRRVAYGSDYDRYIRDYDKYQKSYAKSIEHDKKRARRSRNGLVAVTAAAAGAGGGGGGGC